ncbi:HNH endonuclease [Aurantibacillus circumpalustris]|uniref:HNH endonuclease n=1 Tax=Aurantibacillus circumpalustris TaxID=3036359 RepID=UPI00295B4730|nr:HNH endonuclease [Aurantibacillus circumpalustris]
MIKNSIELFNGINKFLDKQKTKKLILNGVIVHTIQKDGDYFCCYINKRKYWLEFSKRHRSNQLKSFIHLFDENKAEHSIVQLTLDSSNFTIENNVFQIRQNRGMTIGRKIQGLEAEFKSLMYTQGFSKKDIIATGDCSKPNYKILLADILLWLKIRVRTKLTLEEKYRGVEDRSTENESEVELDDVLDIESKTEGGQKVVISMRAERNTKLRATAMKIHGLKCKACGFDFQKKYGAWGKDYIEVHHAVPLSTNSKRETDPAKDLTVVCSNCHRMIHRKKNITLTIQELKVKLG